MKKFLLTVLILLFMASSAYGAGAVKIVDGDGTDIENRPMLSYTVTSVTPNSFSSTVFPVYNV